MEIINLYRPQVNPSIYSDLFGTSFISFFILNQHIYILRTFCLSAFFFLSSFLHIPHPIFYLYTFSLFESPRIFRNNKIFIIVSYLFPIVSYTAALLLQVTLEGESRARWIVDIKSLMSVFLSVFPMPSLMPRCLHLHVTLTRNYHERALQINTRPDLSRLCFKPTR